MLLIAGLMVEDESAGGLAEVWLGFARRVSR